MRAAQSPHGCGACEPGSGVTGSVIRISSASVSAAAWSTFSSRATEVIMLYWALVFFIVALAAGFFGFFGIASAAAGIAKILFFIFVILFLLSLVSGLRGRPLW
jgi:uncharacterized membrane protein YtjA (UPF0391 family)